MSASLDKKLKAVGGIASKAGNAACKQAAIAYAAKIKAQIKGK